jgi:para-nitrobenzyl esterase
LPEPAKIRTRAMISRMVCAVLAPAMLLAPAAQAQTAPRVRIDSGEIEGVADGAVQRFLGIPYAAPPVRNLRWRDPQPVAAWKGIFHADRFGPQCVQPQRPILSNSYSGAEITSEDCLTLNVWTKPGLSRAPVIVYIHGGAFFIGSGSMALYGGEAIAREGAVFVNLNYRLGALGMMAHPDLSKESPHGTSGNYAFLDQIAALQWVRRNIARFGGGPGNVTIVGQSAGSMSVNMLQASPLARRLFHRAVGMSGSLLEGPSNMPPLREAEQEGVRLQGALKAKSLADLRAMPADRIVVPRPADGPKIGPIVDGYALPRLAEQVFAGGEQADVPLMLGFTHDESFGGLGPVTGLADYRARAESRFGARAAEFLALYPADTDAAARAQAQLADRDGTMAIGMDAWARVHTARGKAPIFAYEFSRRPLFTPGAVIEGLDVATAGAYHTSEVPFWLGTLDSFNLYRATRDWTAGDRAMSRAMVRALVAFARTGDPQAGGVRWRRYDPADRNLIEIGETIRPGTWPSVNKLDFFRSVAKLPPSGRVRE